LLYISSAHRFRSRLIYMGAIFHSRGFIQQSASLDTGACVTSAFHTTLWLIRITVAPESDGSNASSRRQ
jgi:hypothetical protein